MTQISRRTTLLASGAGLAGLAGALVAPLKSVSPEMGTGYVVDAFMVVVVGGVQSLFGAVASAALLGQASGVLGYVANDTVARAAVLLAVVFEYVAHQHAQQLLNFALKAFGAETLRVHEQVQPELLARAQRHGGGDAVLQMRDADAGLEVLEALGRQERFDEAAEVEGAAAD